MKVLILAGGLGTRISEESHLRPKPMIEIGDFPILVHIMRIYSTFNFKDFIICAGYKQQVIKEYFQNFDIYTSDVEFDFRNKAKTILSKTKFDWKVSILDTGLHTQTGGRILRCADYVGNETFMVTYGDAVGNINIEEVLKAHKASGKIGTICVYNFGQSKGVVEIGKNNLVTNFREKSDLDGDLINIGFMIFEPKVFKYIKDDDTIFEKDVLPLLAKEGELNCYIHKGFWQCMDTMKEKEILEKLYASDNCPWRIWKDA